MRVLIACLSIILFFSEGSLAGWFSSCCPKIKTLSLKRFKALYHHPEDVEAATSMASLDDGSLKEQPMVEPGEKEYQLSLKYEVGRSVRKNQKLALASLLKAAELGHKDAQYYMGMKYLQGIGVKPNPVLALEWISKSAEGGNAEAHLVLGKMYEKGSAGLKVDAEQATKYYALSAALGNREAEEHLNNLVAIVAAADSEECKCYICYINLPNMSIIPCGHTICEECGPKLIIRNCPKCREPIMELHKMSTVTF